LKEALLSRTVFLHVGVAKTGTTYLQRLLFANKALLKSNGVLYPGDRPAAHFLASMDLRGSGFGGHDYPGAQGMWDRITRESNQFSGSTVISHETLARCRRKVISRAVDGFNTDDIRVVLTTRDLGRQIPAVWQENVKNRNSQSYADFLDEVLRGAPGIDPGEGKRPAKNFWRPQNLPDLVRRWARVVGNDNVTVVTVPPPGSPRNELWNRFADAVELPDLPYTFDLDSDNVSLGATEAELLRRMTAHVPDDVDWPRWETRVKRRFAERTLAPLGGTTRIVLPDSTHDAVSAMAEQMIARISRRGVRVIGDLDDLRPRFEEATGPQPDQVSDADLLTSALTVLGPMASAAPERAPRLTIERSTIVERLRARVRRHG
jgi:hypothetical protein